MPSTRLDDEQVASYERDGFLAIERLVDDETLELLRRAYDEVLAATSDEADAHMLGGITTQVMMPSLRHPDFATNAAVEAARSLVDGLLDDPTFFFDMLIFKPPRHPHETPWHQDMAYTGQPYAAAGTPIPLHTIQFWVALDDADTENGCMHFLPGYQRQPLLEHCVAAGAEDDPRRLLGLVHAEAQVDLSSAVAAPLTAGGATMHSYGTPHYTPPNTSTTRPRRAYIFSFSTPQMARLVEQAVADQ